MSSEAEKRQKLRERRAAKIKNGASRLGKITGDYSEAQKDAETIRTNPLSSPETKSPTPEPSIGKETPISKSSGASKRISQSFDHEDPEVEDISNFEPIKESSKESSRANQPSDQLDEAQQFEQMLQQMLGSVPHQHQGDSNNSTDAPQGTPDFDIFSKLLSGDANGQGNPFGSLGSMGALQQTQAQKNQSQGYDPAHPDVNLEQIEYQKQLSEYNKIQNDKFKAKFMLFKFIISFGLTIYFFGIQGFYSSSVEIFRIHKLDSGFSKIWLTLEILFTSYYALHLNKIQDSHYNYNSKILKILGYVPDMFLSPYYKNKIRWFVKYQELIHLIIFDLSVIIFLFGILSFWHSTSIEV
ncbi:putative membrane protein [Wickerhamomyces ciferrii]|uniref:Membrane protein n=1 Tax=Wickerhamomyces ciferrii (strain ATCC 14091 / BCRC 22168 / CBS 111 / JCM 3599 / NBRC 0793 / NRRL Y-1031 F-60-10) TaxID=1206466 RepID=K0KE31_WICCF|nr:uncharacterized protein BN7_2903 [Wickerhamomyces ciferrii]CCH43355.1 putative membrane protein [Wickerhamomyces ciferrii]